VIDFGGKSALCEHGRAEPMNWWARVWGRQ